MTLTSRQWARIERLLPGKNGDRGRHGADNRMFVEAVLSVLRNDSNWHDLSDVYGKWKSIHARFVRLAERGIWEKVFEKLVADGQNRYLPRDKALLAAYRASEAAKRKLPRSKWWRTPNKHGDLGALHRPWRGQSIGERIDNALDFIERNRGSTVSNATEEKPKRGRPRRTFSADQKRETDALVVRLSAQRRARL